MVVDFDRVKAICPQLKTVWLRKVNSRLRQVTLSGEQLEKDEHYKGMSKSDHSGVIINWEYDGIEHPILVTRTGSIALVKNYSKCAAYELELIMHVHDNLLSKAWVEKPARHRKR